MSTREAIEGLLPQITGAALRLVLHQLDFSDPSSSAGIAIPDVSKKGPAQGNDTAIFQELIDMGARYIFVPRTATPWRVGDLNTPVDGVTFLGQSDPRYFSSAPSVAQINNQSCFRLPSGATCMFRSPGNVTLENMWLYGLGKGITDPPVFLSSTGAKIPDLFARRCNIHMFSLGFGERTTYFGTSLIEECIVSFNYHGVGYLVDSKVKGGFIHSNDSHGVYLSPGSNDNVIEGPKLEWNTGHGLFAYGARRNVGSLIVADSNGQDGLRVESQSSSQPAELTLSASVSRRNGRSSGRNVFLRNPGVFLCQGLITQSGPNDNGSGTNRPGTNVEVVYTDGGVPTGSLTRIRDSDLRGYVTTAFSRTGDTFLTAASGSLKVADCAGVVDVTV